MPELPEVENIVKQLQLSLINQRLKQVYFSQEKLRKNYPLNIESIYNSTIKQIYRIAKYICIYFVSNNQKDHTLQIHLGMTGKLLIKTEISKDAKSLLHPYHRNYHGLFLFSIKNHSLNPPYNLALLYQDSRRFGSITLNRGLITKIERGIEPLSQEFSFRYLHQHSKKSKGTIKSLIMNNNIVVGIGNIYACEALWLAGINPFKRGDQCTLEEITILVHEIKNVLLRAIESGGSTIRDYKDSENKGGSFQLHHMVYNKAETKCSRCFGSIVKSQISNRATYYCPTCQV